MVEKNQHLQQILNKFSGCRLAVIGDLMIDSYVWGDVERISPEAPVPIVQVRKTSCCLGGAGNVMRNIVTLGGSVEAFGVVGDDDKGVLLKEMLAEYGISTNSVMLDYQRPSICKERVIAGSQQLLRIDYEDTAALDGKLRGDLVAAVKRRLDSGDIQALVLEDYAKGLFSQEMAQELVDYASSLNIATVLDPNPRNRMELNNLTIMKPNRNEAFALAGRTPTPQVGKAEEDTALQEVARCIQERWQVKYLLISLAAQGMALFEENGKCSIIPTRAREVYDVSGAGDTVVAAVSLALAAGGDVRSAAELANHAAGVVVRQLGTATVSAAELTEALQEA